MLLTGCLFSPAETQAARGMELALQDEAIFVVGSKRVAGRQALRLRPASRRHPAAREPALGVHDVPAAVQRAAQAGPDHPYDFQHIDALVDRAAENGHPHAPVADRARRRAGRARARPQPQSGAWYKPNTAEFGKWAGVVAEHFRGRVDRYSIWNEPNWKTWLGPLDERPVALPLALLARLQRHQEGRLACEGADRRDEPVRAVRACRPRRSRSCAPSTCVNKKYKRARNCTQAEGGRLRAPPVRLPRTRRTSSTRARTT